MVSAPYIDDRMTNNMLSEISETMQEAETAMDNICGLVDSLLQSNNALQARLLSVDTI